jgi:hypothetical protein
MAAAAPLNIKVGKDAVRCDLFLSSGAWQTGIECRSPAYTSDWRQLMIAQ